MSLVIILPFWSEMDLNRWVPTIKKKNAKMVMSLAFRSWLEKLGYFDNCDHSTWFWGLQHSFQLWLGKWTGFEITIEEFRNLFVRGSIIIAENELISWSWLEVENNMFEGFDCD